MNINLSGMPSKEFVSQVKQLLAHLYDFGYIKNHPLSAAIEPPSPTHSESAWEYLRKELLLAIEALSPSLNPAISSPRSRLYHILQLHYVEELPLQQCAQELGLSLRQTNRELRSAEQSVAAVLWAKVSKLYNKRQPVEQDPRLIQSEINHIKFIYEPEDIFPLISDAKDEVSLLAGRQGIELYLHQLDKTATVLVDKTIARQVLIHLFSRLVQSSNSGTIEMELMVEEVSPVLRIRFCPRTAETLNYLKLTDPFIELLLQRMEWSIQVRPGNPAEFELVFDTSYPPTLLVIDDNEGLGILLQRYLAGIRCLLVVAHHGEEGILLANQIEPDAIFLDVMMPGIDGWQVISHLKANAATRAIPVVICSVFNDPALASSLGAASFLPKPVSRESFLNAMREVGL